MPYATKQLVDCKGTQNVCLMQPSNWSIVSKGTENVIVSKGTHNRGIVILYRFVEETSLSRCGKGKCVVGGAIFCLTVFL